MAKLLFEDALGKDPVMAIVGAMQLLGKEYGWIDAPLNLGITFPPDSVEGQLEVIGNPRMVRVPNVKATEVRFFVNTTLVGCLATIAKNTDHGWEWSDFPAGPWARIRAARPLVRDLQRGAIRCKQALAYIQGALTPDDSLKPNLAAFAWDACMYGALAISAAAASSPQIKGVLQQALLSEIPNAPGRVLHVVLGATEDALKWVFHAVGEALNEFGHAAGIGGLAILIVGAIAVSQLR